MKRSGGVDVGVLQFTITSNHVHLFIAASQSPEEVSRLMQWVHVKKAGVYLCGDHFGSASIEGAIISGLRTADAILKPS